MTDWPKRASEIMNLVRERKPMIHHITNMVVTNLTANVTLCLGAAPVMAPCPEEVEEMVSFAGALLLNIGTLDPPLVASMVKAGRAANQLGIPVVLDPVGVGATRLRTDSAREILSEVDLAVVRGNAGEVLTLAGAQGKVRGVDSRDEIGARDALVAQWAREQGLVAAVTGPVDFVTDGKRRLKIHNGHPLLTLVTGTGCSAATAVAAGVAAAPENPLEGAASGLAAFGLAAEIAAEKAEGPGSFVPILLDVLAKLDSTALQQGIKIEEV